MRRLLVGGVIERVRRYLVVFVATVGRPRDGLANPPAVDCNRDVTIVGDVDRLTESGPARALNLVLHAVGRLLSSIGVARPHVLGER